MVSDNKQLAYEVEGLKYQDTVTGEQGILEMNDEILKARHVGDEQLNLQRQQLQETMKDMENHFL